MPLEQPLNIVYQRQDPMHQEAAGWNLETNQAAMGGLKFSAEQKKEQKKAWSRRISARSGRSTRG